MLNLMPDFTRTINKLAVNRLPAKALASAGQLSTVRKSKGFTLIELLVARHPKPWRRKAVQGFTLIELLVVIAIIGILATVIVASFTSAQQRGRDARRKADLDAIKKALELAKSDSTGYSFYPQNSPQVVYFGTPFPNGGSNSGAYMKNVPLDPVNTPPHVYSYTATNCVGNWPQGGCTGYFLQTTLENSNDPDRAPSWARCPGAPPGPDYVVCSY